MKITGVICEYNPFHNGHEWMLRQLRENGSTHIIACMSGNFTQRGDAAVFDKWTRTRAALSGGADLVIELPVTFACAGAERFAFGGVSLLHSLGCVDEIAFGSECGNVSLLNRTAQLLDKQETYHTIHEIMSSGISFAAARQKAVGMLFGTEYGSLLSEPNNILGVEYCKALNRLQSHIIPVSVPRNGVPHDSLLPEGNIASAGYIRHLIDQGTDFSPYVPAYAAEIFSETDNPPPANGRMSHLEQSVLYRLRMMTADDFSHLPDISEGLENRLFSAVREKTTVNEILSAVTSKRCPRARIARIVMHAFLGITKEALRPAPPYIHVLGMNTAGQEILRIAGKKALLPVIMRYADIRGQSDVVKQQFALEARCDDIYALSGKNAGKCGKTMTIPPYRLL